MVVENTDEVDMLLEDVFAEEKRHKEILENIPDEDLRERYIELLRVRLKAMLQSLKKTNVIWEETVKRYGGL